MPVTESRKARHLVTGVAALALASAMAVATAAPASAVEPDPIILDAGIACEFTLQIDIRGGKRIERTFTDKDGNPVKFLSAGKGFELRFTRCLYSPEQQRSNNRYLRPPRRVIGEPVPGAPRPPLRPLY